MEQEHVRTWHRLKTSFICYFLLLKFCACFLHMLSAVKIPAVLSVKKHTQKVYIGWAMTSLPASTKQSEEWKKYQKAILAHLCDPPVRKLLKNFVRRPTGRSGLRDHVSHSENPPANRRISHCKQTALFWGLFRVELHCKAGYGHHPQKLNCLWYFSILLDDKNSWVAQELTARSQKYTDSGAYPTPPPSTPERWIGIWLLQRFLWTPGHCGVKGNDWILGSAGKGTLQTVACVLEDLECFGAWNCICRYVYRAKDITPLIIWRREA